MAQRSASFHRRAGASANAAALATMGQSGLVRAMPGLGELQQRLSVKKSSGMGMGSVGSEEEYVGNGSLYDDSGTETEEGSVEVGGGYQLPHEASYNTQPLLFFTLIHPSLSLSVSVSLSI